MENQESWEKRKGCMSAIFKNRRRKTGTDPLLIDYDDDRVPKISLKVQNFSFLLWHVPY
jgi:hypothetical protein